MPCSLRVSDAASWAGWELQKSRWCLLSKVVLWLRSSKVVLWLEFA